MFYVDQRKNKGLNKEFDVSLKRVFPLRAHKSFPRASCAIAKYWNKDEPFLHYHYFVHGMGCGPSRLKG